VFTLVMATVPRTTVASPFQCSSSLRSSLAQRHLTSVTVLFSFFLARCVAKCNSLSTCTILQSHHHLHRRYFVVIHFGQVCGQVRFTRVQGLHRICCLWCERRCRLVLHAQARHQPDHVQPSVCCGLLWLTGCFHPRRNLQLFSRLATWHDTEQRHGERKCDVMCVCVCVCVCVCMRMCLCLLARLRACLCA
jgi:hypothetical protein